MTECCSHNQQQSRDEDQVCWVCLDAEGELIHPCKCPRVAHAKCLARWQLQSAGRDEERCCRFCNQTLPDWRPVLTPSHLKPSIPVVSVHYNGVCYRLRVRPGPEGYNQFCRQLHKITGMPMLECMQITFQCKAPDTAQELSFKGISAFDAAIHCAAVSAAERLTHGSSSRRRSSAPESQQQGTTSSNNDTAAQQQQPSSAQPSSTSSVPALSSSESAPQPSNTTPSSHTQSYTPSLLSEPQSASDSPVSSPMYTSHAASLARTSDPTAAYSSAAAAAAAVHSTASASQQPTAGAVVQQQSVHTTGHKTSMVRDFLRRLFAV